MANIKTLAITAQKGGKALKAIGYYTIAKHTKDYDKKMMYLYKGMQNAEILKRML